MKLFSNNIVPYTSTEGDKIYPIVVDIKKGIKSGEAISFVTADNQVGVITVDFMDGNSSYSIEDCMVTSTIRRPDGTVLEIPCDIISQSTIEIPLGINGTYQEGVHTFDLKIVRGNGKVIGVPTMSYSVSGSLSSDGVVEGDDRLPVLTMVLDNAQDKLTRLDKAIAGATNDLEVKEARDGEVTLNARLERDLAKGKIHFVDIEGSSISTESEEGYLENVEIHGNTWQDANNLYDIRSVGTKVEGQELYKIDVVSCGKNLFNKVFKDALNNINGVTVNDSGVVTINGTFSTHAMFNVVIPKGEYRTTTFSDSRMALHVFWQGRDSSFQYGKVLSYTEDITLQCYISSGTYDNYICKFQLEEGTQATTFEEYKEDKLTILSPTPLEKVGDIADRIICKDGVYGVEKNIYTITSDVFYKHTPNMWYVSESKCPVWVSKNIWNMIENKIMCNYYSEVATYVDVENGVGIFIDHKGTHPNIIIGTGDETITSLPEDLEVKYQLVQPQFIPLPHDQQIKLRTFADRTHIHFDTEIQPTLKAQVPKSLGATVNSHTTQIDNLNKELDRVKKLEESTVSTLTSSKAFTTIAETSTGYFEDVKIEGKTLVNLLGSQGMEIITLDTNGNRVKKFINVNHLNGKTYTIVFNITRNSNDIGVFLNHYTDAYNSVHTVKICNGGTIGLISTTLTLGNNYNNELNMYIQAGSSGVVEIKDVLLLEGDHTDNDLSFFEGLKSVGQDTDEISVLSTDSYVKVLDENDIPQAVRSQTKFEIYEGRRVYSSNHNVMTTFDFNGNVYSTGYVYCDIDGKSDNIRFDVKFEGTRDILIHFRDKDKNTINGEGAIHLAKFSCDNKWTTIYAKLPKGTKYYNIRLAHLSSDAKKAYLDLDSIKVSNNVSKELKQDKKQVLYYNPTTQAWEKPILREWDSIEKHSDGKYYYHKRSSELVLNGSESWNIRTDLDRDNTSLFTANIGNGFGGSNDTNCISNRFIATTSIYSDDTEGFYRNAGYIYIRINKSKLSTQDAQGFKTWLQANPTTVVYQLAQEEVYACTNLDLITYSGETNLIVNSGAIQPRITLKVLSNVSNVVKLLQEKVSVLENKFIEGLKQVLAGDMMSLAHLLYPEDFENSHEIQTLEL